MNSGGSSPDRRRVRRLTEWFDASARDLPWRRRRTGYRALVAEAMLQQTQVARVLEHYEQFLRRFPTVRALAEAPEQDVLAAWQGLGYYRRARNLRAAARVIVADHGGRVPRRADELRRLPGVGRYTAGAIASIVHGHREPIVDGNVQRVIARWDAEGGDPRAPETVRRAWARARQLVDLADRPGALNEALMEFGATVCTPRGPNCDACPVARWCAALGQGRVAEIPPAKTTVARPVVHHHAVIVRRGPRVLLEQRPPRGLWSSMWQTPTVEADRELPPAEIAAALAIRVTALARAGGFEHVTSHRRVRFHVYAARTRARRGTWRGLDDLADLPLSNAHRRVLAHVLDHDR